MSKYKFIIIGAMAILILGAVAGPKSSTGNQNTVQLHPDIKMDKAEFGFLSIAQDGSIIFIESDRVPLKVDTPYGWRIHLITKRDGLTWKEVFILPKAPRIWGYKDDTKIDDKGEVAITEKRVQIKDGWIANGWSVAKGDPPGTYVMEIYIEGILAKRFSFVLE